MTDSKFQCLTCDKKYSTKGNLKQHIKSVHDKIKDFCCDRCDYKSSTKGNLKQHIKICTGVRIGSSGEVRVKETLEQMRVQYIFDTSYEVKSSVGLLRWGFQIFYEEKRIGFIEYDGKQHYQPVDFFGGKEGFKKSVKRDKIKNKFAKDYNIKIKRIKYNEYNKIEQILNEEFDNV